MTDFFDTLPEPERRLLELATELREAREHCERLLRERCTDPRMLTRSLQRLQRAKAAAHHCLTPKPEEASSNVDQR